MALEKSFRLSGSLINVRSSCRRLTEIGASIRQTFEPVILSHLYPRSEISIYVQVLGSDGGSYRYSNQTPFVHQADLHRPCAHLGILPTAINATTLALIDAGVAMTDYITSLSVGLHLTQPLLDLSSPEESDIPYLVVASLPGTGKVTLATLETRIHIDRFEEMLAVGVEGCKILKAEMEGQVKKRTGTMVDRMKLNALPDRAGIKDLDRDILMT